MRLFRGAGFEQQRGQVDAQKGCRRGDMEGALAELDDGKGAGRINLSSGDHPSDSLKSHLSSPLPGVQFASLQPDSALAMVGLIGASLYGAYSHGVTVTNAAWDAQWQTAVATQQAKLADAIQAARTEEQRLQHEANQVGTNAREKNAAADVDGLGLDAAGDRLHVQASKLAAGANTCTGNAGTTDRGASATRAAMVLSQLLERADARAGDLAKAYDRARIAGEACEQAYDLRVAKRKSPPP